MYPKNAASPPVIAVGQVILIADGSVVTADASARVKIGTGGWGASAGTLACDTTSGCWTYVPSQAETNAESFLVAVYKAACIGCQVTVVTSASATAGKVVLSGETHTSAVIPTVTTVTTATNLTNERGKYANGAVWIGPSVNTNTVSYTDGIITNPVSTIAAAKTIADALGMRRFEVIRTGTVQMGSDLTGYRISGVGWSLTTTGGSRDAGTTAFVGGQVVGGTFASTTGTINWVDCEFATGVTIGVSNMLRCMFQGTLTLSTAGNYDFIDCASVVAGTGTPVFAVPAGTVNISFRRWSGGIRFTGITSATTISIDCVSGGTVTLEGTDGNVQVRGMVAGITDSRTGSSITLGQNAAINITKINTEADTALSDIKLDHLVAVADADDVVDNSIIAKLASKGATADWSTFVNTTDALEAVRDNMGTAQSGDSYAIVNGDHGLVSIQDDMDTVLTRLVGTILAGSHTAQSGDSYAIVNGDHGLVSIQDDIDAILVDTGTDIPATITTIDTLLDRMAPILIGTVTGGGTATEVFVYGGVTVTVSAESDGDRSAVAFS